MAAENITAEEQGKTFTQEEVNALIGARLDRERAKYADYESLRADAEAYRAARDAERSDLEKATERIAELEAEKAERDAAEKRSQLVSRIMTEHNVDSKFASLLTAADEEGLAAQAKLIGERFAEPSHRDGGKPAGVADPDAERREFAHQFFGGNS